MWLRVLHSLGLTNLTDEQVSRYEARQAIGYSEKYLTNAREIGSRMRELGALLSLVTAYAKRRWASSWPGVVWIVFGIIPLGALAYALNSFGVAFLSAFCSALLTGVLANIIVTVFRWQKPVASRDILWRVLPFAVGLAVGLLGTWAYRYSEGYALTIISPAEGALRGCIFDIEGTAKNPGREHVVVLVRCAEKAASPWMVSDVPPINESDGLWGARGIAPCAWVGRVQIRAIRTNTPGIFAVGAGFEPHQLPNPSRRGGESNVRNVYQNLECDQKVWPQPIGHRDFARLWTAGTASAERKTEQPIARAKPLHASAH